MEKNTKNVTEREMGLLKLVEEFYYVGLECGDKLSLRGPFLSGWYQRNIKLIEKLLGIEGETNERK